MTERMATFGPSALATPANAITIGRLLTTPALLALILDGHHGWAAVTLWIVLSCTDGADGWIARPTCPPDLIADLLPGQGAPGRLVAQVPLGDGAAQVGEVVAEVPVGLPEPLGDLAQRRGRQLVAGQDLLERGADGLAIDLGAPPRRPGRAGPAR